MSLDNTIKEDITFIKLDVEGSELKALQGAKNIILRCFPKMAVCVYHKYEDILILYKYMKSLGDYRFYMRAQMDNVDTEITMYAIP